MLDIKEKDIENYTNIPLTDYIETIQQGYCEQCKKNIPQEHGLAFFHCPEHGQIKQAEEKCPDCGGYLKQDIDYYLINGIISQHRKQHLLCNCNNHLWLTFFKKTDSYFTIGEDNIPESLTVEGWKWNHNMQNALLINNTQKGNSIQNL